MILLSRFLSTNSESVLYWITDPFLRKKMAKEGIFWSRYQIPSDHKIFRVCTKLRRAGTIFNQFIDQHNLTNIIIEEGSRPIPIRAMSHFALHFHQHYEVQAIIQQNTARDAFEEDMDIDPPVAAVAPAPATAAAAIGTSDPPAVSPLTAGSTAKIIDIP